MNKASQTSASCHKIAIEQAYQDKSNRVNTTVRIPKETIMRYVVKLGFEPLSTKQVKSVFFYLHRAFETVD